ncbi:GDP-mannose 4,6-dehydratase [bacterium]|nr:GDP-mannose 4,6-dehydratase [bacterium]
MSKKVLITGVTGQDGSHMADYLIKNTDCHVIGAIRRLSSPNHINIQHLKDHPRFELIDMDITDSHNVESVVQLYKPDYFINFAANSFVGSSWAMPANHLHTNCYSVLYQLEAIKRFAPLCRYYNAGSSEEFGDVIVAPQDELHPLRARSPYGASKASARMFVKVYRESYNLYAVQGWLFNHEGTRRGEEFVTRKISKAVARIKKDLDNGILWDKAPLELGNLEAKRDWSDAEDFMDGVWRMLNQDKHREFSRSWCFEPDKYKQLNEYVLSSNETHTIREFVELAFKAAGIDGYWVNDTGEEKDERFLTLIKKEGHLDLEIPLVSINEKFYRPAEVELLLGDSTRAREELGWKPQSTFQDLVEKMVNNDIKEMS